MHVHDVLSTQRQSTSAKITTVNARVSIFPMESIWIAPGIHVELLHVVAVRRGPTAGNGHELGTEQSSSLVHRYVPDTVPSAGKLLLGAQA